MAISFTPLHSRSNYSLLRGVPSPERLIALAARMGYHAFALTDVNNLYAAIPFHRLAKEAGIKPIVGCEIMGKSGGALLLAENLDGYRNLCRIITRRNLDENFSLVECLARHSGGLHALTEDVALAERLAPVLDRDRLWLALSWPRRSRRHIENLIDGSRRLGLELVASPRSFFIDKSEHETHRLLTAIREKALLSELPDESLDSADCLLPSPERFAEIFRRRPDALRNNARIVERCSLDLPTGKPIFPHYPLPEGETERGFLERLCRDGLRRRHGAIPAASLARLERELGVIDQLGFSGYFIFVWDILGFARERGIPTIGRGSGAGSIVSYALGITNVDPVAYDIPFERFLHFRRADCPDLDVDLCWKRRDELIEHIYEKYGAMRVAMVSTHSAFGPRAAIRETARALGIPDGAVGRLCNNLPYASDDNLRRLLGGARTESAALMRDPEVSVAIELAERIRGFPRHIGTHCGGLVMADGTLDSYVPLQRAAKGILITQYEKDAIEEIGLVKMDFLGNHGLTVRAETLGLVARNGEAPRPEEIPERDEATARMLREGRTLGCGQLESPAMRNLLSMLQPQSPKEIMRALALIRPGPAAMGMKERFVRRSRGLEPVAYPHPLLADALKDNFGVMLYEDDVMLAACALAGMTPEEGDLLRKTLKKERSPERLEAAFRRFADRAAGRGVSNDVAREVWEMMLKFRSYSFCKAHAASYALPAWHLAWLKAHHPLEFMVAALNHQWGMYPRRVHLSEARRLGIGILPPCVNRSMGAFTAEDGRIRVGLESMMGLGGATIETIIDARRDGAFDGMSDFAARTRLGASEMESLALCGGFDFTGRTRPQMIWELKSAFQRRGKGSGGTGVPLFLASSEPPPLPEYSPERRLAFELTILDLPVSMHPMEPVRPRLERSGFIRSGALEEMKGRVVRLAGVPAASRRVRTRTGGMMEFLTLEDEDRVFEATLFPSVYERLRGRSDEDGPYLVEGTVEDQYGALSINARRIRRMESRATNAS